MSKPQPAPHRVLVVSADGERRSDATATALEEAVQRIWPGSETHRLDTSGVLGPGIGPLFRRLGVANVRGLQLLDTLFYVSLWRYRWFTRASERITGSWCGRRLATQIDRFDPDLIVSTYPLGSSGLAWLRRRRGLSVPVGCWVSDFAPHPLWVYSELDTTFVMHETAVAVAVAAEPAARVEICALPAPRHPADQATARARLGLREDALVVLLPVDSEPFGDIESTVRALVGASRRVQVLAVCGNNEQVREFLDRLGLPRDVLVPLGWTDDVEQCYRAADLVVGDAGGTTALGALATETPRITTPSTTAHADANADLMTVAGLTDLGPDVGRLQTLVHSAADDATILASQRRRIRDNLAPHDLDGALRRFSDRGVSGSPADRTPWPMRPADAFFTHAETSGIRQELGAVLELGPLPHGRPLTVDALCQVVQPRTAGLPSLRRVLRRDAPGWDLLDRVDVTDHIHGRATEGPGTDPWDLAGDFWSIPLRAGRPGWEMQLISARGHARSLLAVKMHHGQADGISALALLDRLLDSADDDSLLERRSSTTDRGVRVERRVLVRGLWSLAGRGRPPRHRLNGTTMSADRDLIGVPVPWPEIRRLTAQLRALPHEIVIALVSDALDRLLRPAGLVSADRPLRAMVPAAVRAPRLDRVFGNWTGALAVDLPLGEMPFGQRAWLVRDELRRRANRGEAAASSAVMSAAGRLPTPLHRAFARTVYNRRFFNTIVSYMPGARGARWCAGARVHALYPVLPLTAGIPVTVGVVVSDGVAGVGIMSDSALGLDREQVYRAVRDAFAGAGAGQVPGVA